MKPWLDRLIRWYKALVTNIAFIPTVMGVASLLFAIGLLYLETLGYADWAKEDIDFALVKGADNARMILTTIIGGILSLTVFSFSMVMVVLNRASASLSPRVLPQLIAHKPHQIVLGFYMGTIVYTLILVINIGKKAGIPSFSILMAMIMAIGSLGLFIYFIHSISQSIQVSNILKSIYNDTKGVIEQMKKSHSSTKLNTDQFEECLVADKPGYYHFIPGDNLLKCLAKNNQKLMICVYQSQFVTAGAPLLKVSGGKDELKDEWLQASMDYAEIPYGNGKFISGFVQMSEIGVKALSPGINDPGTAIRALHVLGILFTTLFPYPTYYGRKYNFDDVVTLERQPDLEEILNESVVPIRHCINGERGVAMAMLDTYDIIVNIASNDDYPVLKRHLLAFMSEFSDQALNRLTLEEVTLRAKKLLVKVS